MWCGHQAATIAGWQPLQWWTNLRAVLGNLIAYYGQFEKAVSDALTAGMAPLEKQLQVLPPRTLFPGADQLLSCHFC